MTRTKEFPNELNNKLKINIFEYLFSKKKMLNKKNTIFKRHHILYDLH